jgi:hypothetical protein
MITARAPKSDVLDGVTIRCVCGRVMQEGGPGAPEFTAYESECLSRALAAVKARSHGQAIRELIRGEVQS